MFRPAIEAARTGGRSVVVEAALRERPCPNATCGCYIGYVHMPDLGQAQIFGDRLLERIPLHVSTSGR